jgi:ABC-type multidrug transport system fused ATPase/permease subunit
MPFHNSRTPGEMIERVDDDITALANFFSQFVIRILGGLLLLVGVLVLLWIEEPRVGAVVTLFVLISRTANLAVPRVTAEREVFAQYYGLVEERLAGVDDIRPNGGGD